MQVLLLFVPAMKQMDTLWTEFHGILNIRLYFIISLINNNSAVAEMGDRLATIDMGGKEGVQCPFLRGAGSPSNTMSPVPRCTSVLSGILIHLAVWRQQTWAENWGRGCRLSQYRLGRGLLHAKFYLDPSNRLDTIHQRHRQTRQTDRR